MKVTPLDIKQFIVEILDLEDIKPDEIEDEQPLFGEGLGLDSIDALEIGVALRKIYKVQMEEDDPDIKTYFQSAKSLSDFVNRFSKVDVNNIGEKQSGVK